jgi:hypothetical protein
MSAAMRKEPRCLRALRIAMIRDKDCATTGHSIKQSTLEGNMKGIYGEIAFEERYHIPVDESYRPSGDGGIDFTALIKGQPVTFNVKTATIPNFLYLKVSAAADCADILVLAQFHLHPYDANQDHAKLLGWVRREVLLQQTPCIPFEEGELSYRVWRKDLIPMSELDKLMEGATDEQGNLLGPATPPR